MRFTRRTSAVTGAVVTAAIGVTVGVTSSHRQSEEAAEGALRARLGIAENSRLWTQRDCQEFDVSELTQGQLINAPTALGRIKACVQLVIGRAATEDNPFNQLYALPKAYATGLTEVTDEVEGFQVGAKVEDLKVINGNATRSVADGERNRNDAATKGLTCYDGRKIEAVATMSFEVSEDGNVVASGRRNLAVTVEENSSRDLC